MVVNLFLLAVTGCFATEVGSPVQVPVTSPAIAQLRLSGALSDTGWVHLYVDIKLKNQEEPRGFLVATGSFDKFDTKFFDFSGKWTVADIEFIDLRVEPATGTEHGEVFLPPTP